MNNPHIGSDVNQAEPTSLSHIIGQKQVTDVLKVHMKAHFNIRSATGDANLPFGPVAFLGPPGTGKTLVAKVIHAELGNLRLYETNGETINTRSELLAILLTADENSTILIDEAHGMNSKTQRIPLTAISEKFLPIDICSMHKPFGIKLKSFALILATTHEYLLQDALRDRMRIYCRFYLYSVAELTEIVKQRAQALGWIYESPEVLSEIAMRAKGSARQALNRNLQMSWQVAQSHDHSSITIADVREAFSLMQVDELGLEDIDSRYLMVLAQAGHLALNVIGSKLDLPSKTIQVAIEPYLIREGFITKDRYSLRVLTEKGRNHVQSIISTQTKGNRQ